MTSPLQGAREESLPQALTTICPIPLPSSQPGRGGGGGGGGICVCVRVCACVGVCTRARTRTQACMLDQVTSASYCSLASATTCWCSCFILSIFLSCSLSTSWRFSLRRPLSCRAGGRHTTCRTENGPVLER